MSRQSRRFARSILIGCAALAALIWMAMDQFGISRREVLDLALVTAGITFLVILAAAALAILWIGLRKFREKS